MNHVMRHQVRSVPRLYRVLANKSRVKATTESFSEICAVLHESCITTLKESSCNEIRAVTNAVRASMASNGIRALRRQMNPRVPL
jgi:hypothetical protein